MSLKSFINQLDQDVKETIWYASFERPEFRFKGDQVYVVVLLYILLDQLLHRFKSLDCRFLGHTIEDESYGGPESGCIDLHCTHCHEEWYTRLY